MPKQAMKQPFKIEFEIGTIKHLGLQMYSTLPPVIGELVSNAWDADAENVRIAIPVGSLHSDSEIVIEDDGIGMTDLDIRSAYLIVGRDKRKEEGDNPTGVHLRKVMGRKGIGKFSGFGIAGEIEIETIKDGETSRFIMSYDEFASSAAKRELLMPPLPATGTLLKGTRITLRKISRFQSRAIAIGSLRRGLARRFSIIGVLNNFTVSINGDCITPDERDLRRLLEIGSAGEKYLWEFDNVEIQTGTGWRVSGWIGALPRTKELEDGIQRGVSVMARGKLVQEPFVFDAVVGQQFALSYIIGELYADFVDEAEDTISTARNSLVWDSEANTAFKDWGQKEVNRIARLWSEHRKKDNEKDLSDNPTYKKFLAESESFNDRGPKRVADKLIRDAIARSPLADAKDHEPVIQLCLDFMQYDAFRELAEALGEATVDNVPQLVQLFREWEIVEAKEMMRVTEGRIATIEKLQTLIDENCLEVPDLHNFLKEFPWVLDPRWTLIADEKRYSQLLREEFPEDAATLEDDKRIDFLCVREGTTIVVVEIKRPKSKASKKEFEQVEEYVLFMRDFVKRTTDPDLLGKEVVGYLLVGSVVDTYYARGRSEVLAKSGIYIRKYTDLLRMVEEIHKDFMARYASLQAAKQKNKAPAK